MTDYTMSKYIDAEKLKAEIDNLESFSCVSEEQDGFYSAISRINGIIDSLQQEQPEVDLEEEIHDYLKTYHLHIKDGGRVVFDNGDSPNFMCDIRDIAHHFYELGLKTRKEG